MGDIYAKARPVVILPGTQIAELDNLRYDENGTAVQVTKENRQHLGEQWTQAEWRSRCWTFQEAYMARATAVVTGSRKNPVLSGAALNALATSREESVKLAPWYPLDNTWLRINAYMYNAEKDGKFHLFSRSHRVCRSCGLPPNHYPPPQKKQHLLVLMDLSWHRKASREQDTVYSLLSMAEGGYQVPVNYDIALEGLYRVLIQIKKIGAEIMALGGGYAGSTTCWIPQRGSQEIDTIMSRRGQWLRTVDAGITDKGTLSAAVVPVTISTDKYKNVWLHLAGLEQPVIVRFGLDLSDIDDG